MRSIKTLALAGCWFASLSLGCGAAAPASAPGAPQEPMTAGVSVADSAEAEEADVMRSAAPSRPAVKTPAQAPVARHKEAAGAAQAEPAPVALAPTEPAGTESYKDYGVNPMTDPATDPLSTFAVDVDTASYSIARSKLTTGSLPPFASVRAEEFVNYFDYEYAAPSQSPFTVHLAAAPSPYDQGHHIVRVGVQAKQISRAKRTPVHLVYLVDTSGSMRRPNKIGLAKRSLKMLTDNLKAGDTVALCTYAGSVREVLPPTGVQHRDRILAAIDSLAAGGSTAMSSGIELAYQLASRTLVKGHVNRVIVLSDGDANVGPRSHEQILKRIGHFKNRGITLSTAGFGRDNYQDTMMEQLANQGNGNYYFIDNELQARRVFVEQLDGMLQVVARDVKIQVEFDPRAVAQYRLIGYENRDVADRDFRNDKVDAGEIGAGHNVTAIYDVVLKASRDRARPPVMVRLRYKQPLGSNRAKELSVPLRPAELASSFEAAHRSLRFATAVAGFAELLRHSPYARGWSFDAVERVARGSAWGRDEQAEFIGLVAQARRLSGGRKIAAAVVAK